MLQLPLQPGLQSAEMEPIAHRVVILQGNDELALPVLISQTAIAPQFVTLRSLLRFWQCIAHSLNPAIAALLELRLLPQTESRSPFPRL